jgi:hypothetical protein
MREIGRGRSGQVDAKRVLMVEDHKGVASEMQA